MTSCTPKEMTGTYTYGNEQFVFKGNQYTYFYKQPFISGYSKGEFKIHGKKLEFLPDSALYPRLSINKLGLKEPYSKTLKKCTLIISEIADNDNEFSLYIVSDNLKDTFYFNRNLENKLVAEVTLDEVYPLNVSILFIKDKYLSYKPVYYKRLISTNVLYNDGLITNSKKIDTVYLNLDFNRNMFGVVDLPNYVLKGRKITQDRWPVFKKKAN